MNIRVVDWRISAICNNECGFCYGCNDKIRDIENRRDIDRVIDFIKRLKCEAVCISGGEPLLCDHFYYILEELYKAHIYIYLSTNGTNYLKNKDKIEPYISKLSLPLDGYDNDTNKIGGRKEGSFGEVKEILDYYQSYPEKVKFKFKIGTVLDRGMHPEHLIKLYDLLSEYSILSKWKIFELIPEGKGEIYKSSDYDTSFYERYKKILKEYVSQKNVNNFEIDFAHRKDRDSAYFVILANGDVIIPVDQLYKNGKDQVEEIFLGNVITDDFDNIVKEWKSNCNENNCIAIYEKRTDLKSSSPIVLDALDKVILYLYDKDPLQIDNTIEEQIKQINSDEQYQNNSNDQQELVNYIKKDGSVSDISQEYIDTRIEELYRLGVIDHVMPLVDVSMFNFSIYLANLYFYPIMKSRTFEIACYLKRQLNIAWVVESHDWKNENDIIFRIAIFAQSPSERSNVIDDIKRRFGEVLKNCVYQDVIDKNVLGQRYMFDNKDETDMGLENSHIDLDCKKEIKLSSQEYAILKFPKDRLYTLKDLSKYLGKPEKKVRKSIESLKDNVDDVIIKKFQAVYNPILMGLKWYKFFVKFKNPQVDKINFENAIKRYPPVMHTNSLADGESIWDMDFEIHIGSAVEAFDFWDHIEFSYGDKIRNYEVIRITYEHKFDFLPEVVMRKIEENLRSSKRFWFMKGKE